MVGNIKNRIRRFRRTTIVLKSIRKLIINRIPNKVFISKNFYKKVGYKINWKNPETFNEKVQWINLYYKDPLMTICADKYEVRDYLKEKGLESKLTAMHGVYEKVEDIDINTLPDKFVLKATHGSGWNIICTDKHKMDWIKELETMKMWLKENYYDYGREWVYKNIKPRIICEEFLEVEGVPPIDYKFMCFNGEPKLLFLCVERFSEEGLKIDFYDNNWIKMPFERYYPNSNRLLPKPKNFDEMIEICRKLSEDFPFVRVDLYDVNGKIYFGELTFIPGNGMEPFQPIEYDHIVGSYLEIPVRKW